MEGFNEFACRFSGRQYPVFLRCDKGTQDEIIRKFWSMIVYYGVVFVFINFAVVRDVDWLGCLVSVMAIGFIYSLDCTSFQTPSEHLSLPLGERLFIGLKRVCRYGISLIMSILVGVYTAHFANPKRYDEFIHKKYESKTIRETVEEERELKNLRQLIAQQRSLASNTSTSLTSARKQQNALINTRQQLMDRKDKALTAATDEEFGRNGAQQGAGVKYQGHKTDAERLEQQITKIDNQIVSLGNQIKRMELELSGTNKALSSNQNRNQKLLQSIQDKKAENKTYVTASYDIHDRIEFYVSLFSASWVSIAYVMYMLFILYCELLATRLFKDNPKSNYCRELSAYYEENLMLCRARFRDQMQCVQSNIRTQYRIEPKPRGSWNVSK